MSKQTASVVDVETEVARLDTEYQAAVERNDAATIGVPFDYKLWFSDTYVCTPSGWRYVFGQASTRLAP